MKAEDLVVLQGVTQVYDRSERVANPAESRVRQCLHHQERVERAVARSRRPSVVGVAVPTLSDSKKRADTIPSIVTILSIAAMTASVSGWAQTSGRTVLPSPLPAS